MKISGGHIEADRSSVVRGEDGTRVVSLCAQLVHYDPLSLLESLPCEVCQRRDALTRLGARKFSACFVCGGVGVDRREGGVVVPCGSCGGARVVLLVPSLEAAARGDVTFADPAVHRRGWSHWVRARPED